MVLIAETESTIKKEEGYAAPAIKPMSPPLEVVAQDSLGEFSINGMLSETAPKMTTEGAPKKIRLR